MKIYVVYDSEGNHTKQLAEAIENGAKEIPSAEVFIDHVDQADIDKLEDMDAIIWGCPGHFGTISSGLKSWIDKLGKQWAKGLLVNKIGAVFCTTATTHGGIETTMLNLITPMLHQGMIIVGLPANVPENALYGSYYGAGVTCSVNDGDILPEEGAAIGTALGRRVAKVVQAAAN
ncbi:MULTISPECIES: NAD(P)H-dependent oxidoreductase [Bacillus]|uniref:Flavodoxin-like domain-containing protein n=2 Tax=Bacillus TaxID=1386 RepID=A0A0M4FKU5_9BACI|nr:MULTISPECIES: NAD(P)H-dependent oxidoreductase [Bacillus]ALC82479.1 hypothetical protein AM592_13465 [Bacillus gobiensis]MBP1081371.1 NAD(P)H dehydrogenase (quinone) [Bacillus capparidis]MED1096044.1 NAD(P)H-dependent oxidoreductase [Bacillus capparidis]